MLKVQYEEETVEDKLRSHEIDRRIEKYKQGKKTPIRLTFDQLADSAIEKYIKRIAQRK